MQPVFLIVDPDAFVAQDLAEILRETVTGAQVIHATSIDVHMMDVVSQMSVYGVFLNGSAGSDAMRAVSERLKARDVGLAWIGSEGQRGFTTGNVHPEPIAAPFTAEAVRAVIDQWASVHPLPNAGNGRAAPDD